MDLPNSMAKPARVAPLEDWLRWRDWLMHMVASAHLGYMVREMIDEADKVIAAKHRQADDLCTMDDAPVVDNANDAAVDNGADDLPF